MISRMSCAMKRMKFTTCSGLPANFSRSSRVLGRHACRTRVQMTHAHHDAADCNERRRREAELFRTQQRGDHDVPPGLQLTIRLHSDATPQIVQHQGLVRFREPQLPRQPGVSN